MYVLKGVIASGTDAEQLMAITIVWKLIANNFKGKHTIRNGTLMAQLNNLISNFDANSSTAETNVATDMAEALNGISIIFSK